MNLHTHCLWAYFTVKGKFQINVLDFTHFHVVDFIINNYELCEGFGNAEKAIEPRTQDNPDHSTKSEHKRNQTILTLAQNFVLFSSIHWKPQILKHQ